MKLILRMNQLGLFQQIWVVKNDQDVSKYSLVTVVDSNKSNIEKIYDFIKKERSSMKDSKLFTKYCEITGYQNYESFGKRIHLIFKQFLLKP